MASRDDACLIRTALTKPNVHLVFADFPSRVQCYTAMQSLVVRNRRSIMAYEDHGLLSPVVKSSCASRFVRLASL